jgi:ribosome biogenesis GTPase
LSSVVGTVLRSHAGGYVVHLPQKDEEDFVLFCQARGRLKKQKVAILTGDRVELGEVNLPERTAVIVQQQERKTFIDRPPLANIDQVVIVQAVRQPDFSPLWMDRYLVHFQLSVPFTRPIICLNKCDLEDENGLIRLRSIYEPLGYFVIFASAETGRGLQELARVLSGKVSVFSGPSGVGKSSLLNKLSPGLDIKVGRMENAFGVGRHTTTYSELYRLKLEGFCPPAPTAAESLEGSGPSLEDTQEQQFSWVADTPGFNVMEFMHSDPRDVATEFPEISALGEYCKYADCLHMVESGCAVLAALGLDEDTDEDADEDLDEEPDQDSDDGAKAGAGEVADSGADADDDVGAADQLPPIVQSRYESYCIMVTEAQSMQEAAKSVSSKKESSVKSVGGEAGAKVRIIPRLHGRYRAASRNTEKQKLPNSEEFDDDDDEIDATEIALDEDS